jgi:hypothetical protein
LTAPDEPRYTSRHIDAQAYADKTLILLAGLIAPVSERRRGYIRDELVDAFEEGQHQELCRALFILYLARQKTTSEETRALLLEVAYLLAPHLREDPE